MSEQEKQKLIKWLEEGIACSEEYGFRGNILKSMQIALTSLTTPPVKLPPKSDVKMGGDVKTRSLLTGMNMMRKSCAEAIRAAGYQVEGE